MNDENAAEPRRRLWEAFDRREFEDVAYLLHDDFIAAWPQSKERIRGRANFIALNRSYPGCWRVTVERICAFGDLVVSEVTLNCDQRTVFAVSFFTVKEEKILAAREYFADTYDPPEWRSQWVEVMDQPA